MDNMIDRAIKQTRKEAHALEIKEYREDYLNLLDANDYLAELMNLLNCLQILSMHTVRMMA